MIFIFEAAVTPVQYERDIRHVTGAMVFWKLEKTTGTEEMAL